MESRQESMDDDLLCQILKLNELNILRRRNEQEKKVITLILPHMKSWLQQGEKEDQLVGPVKNKVE